MSQNQGPVLRALDAGCKLTFAVPDHPWPADDGDAEIRISMTVVARRTEPGKSRIVLTPIHDRVARGKDLVTEVEERDLRMILTENIPPDLSPSVDASTLKSLRSNLRLSSAGMKPYCRALLVDARKAVELFPDPAVRAQHAPEYRNGQDIGQRPRGVHVLDFFGYDEAELCAKFPAAYQHLLLTAKLERSQERNPRLRAEWWLFEANRPELRDALKRIPRYIATVENSPVRVFVFLDVGLLPDQKLRVDSLGRCGAAWCAVLTSPCGLFTLCGGPARCSKYPGLQHSMFHPISFPRAPACASEAYRRSRGILGCPP